MEKQPGAAKGAKERAEESGSGEAARKEVQVSMEEFLRTVAQLRAMEVDQWLLANSRGPAAGAKEPPAKRRKENPRAERKKYKAGPDTVPVVPVDKGFLTAMRQEVTRAHKGWALDSVTIQNDVLKQVKEEITASPTEGVYVYGLYLDGASWDKRNGKLTESPAKVLFVMLPVVHIFAINSTSPKDPKLYTCPVYKKPRRTDLTYITVLWLRTIQSPDHWIMRGVALLCDIK